MTAIVIKATGATLLDKLNQAHYSRYLAMVHGCVPDEVGNRPCDNGALCWCHNEQEMPFDKWLKTATVVSSY